MARMTIFLSQIETARAPAPARVTGRMSRHLGQDKKVYSAMRFDNGQMDRVWLIPPLGQKTCSLAQVAQLVEQRTENPRVGGSNPPLGTTRSDRLRSKRSLTEIVRQRRLSFKVSEISMLHGVSKPAFDLIKKFYFPEGRMLSKNDAYPFFVYSISSNGEKEISLCGEYEKNLTKISFIKIEDIKIYFDFMDDNVIALENRLIHFNGRGFEFLEIYKSECS